MKLRDLINKNLEDLNDQEKEEVASIIGDLLRKTITHFETFVYPEWIQGYKDKNLYMGDRLKLLIQQGQSWRSNRKFPLIPTAHDTYFSNVYDSDYKIKSTPRNSEEDKEYAEAHQAFNEWAYSLSDTKHNLMQIINEAILIGNSFGRVGFHDASETINYKGNEEKIETKYPKLNYISPFSMLFDPASRSFEKSRRKAYRTFMPIEDAIDMYGSTFDFSVSDDEYEDIVNSSILISSMSYDRVKEIKSLEYAISGDIIRSKDFETQSGNLGNESTVSVNEQNFFSIERGYNDIIEVIEFWIGNKVIVLFNGYVMVFGASPYPFSGDPFVHLAYEKVPGYILAKGIAQKLRPFQQAIDTIFNTYLDAVIISGSPMFEQRSNKKGEKQFTFIPFGIREYRDGENLDIIKLIDFNAISQQVQALNQIQSDADRTAGLNSYTVGAQGKVERSAAGVTSRQMVTKSRLLPLNDNINRFLSRVSELWGIMASNYLPDDFMVGIAGKDGSKVFKTITPKSLINRFDVEIDNQSLKSQSRETKREQLMALINTVGGINVDALRGGQPIVDMRELLHELFEAREMETDLIPSDETRLKIMQTMQSFQTKMQEFAQSTQPASEEQQQGQGDGGGVLAGDVVIPTGKNTSPTIEMQLGPTQINSMDDESNSESGDFEI